MIGFALINGLSCPFAAADGPVRSSLDERIQSAVRQRRFAVNRTAPLPINSELAIAVLLAEFVTRSGVGIRFLSLVSILQFSCGENVPESVGLKYLIGR